MYICPSITTKQIVRFILAAIVIIACLHSAKSIVRADIPTTASGDSRASSKEWNEYARLPMTQLAAHRPYIVSFDYKIAAGNSDTIFYSLFRASSPNANGTNVQPDWQRWHGTAGTSGHEEFSYFTQGVTDLQLVLGIQNEGAISISNLQVDLDKSQLGLDISNPALIRSWNASPSTTFYVDSVHGSDSSNGRSAAHAWRSLDKINSGTFASGDKILLSCGSAWNGFFAPGGSGSKAAPIVIDSYGKGAKPKIDAQGKWLATLYLQNASYVTVRDLDIANAGQVPQPRLRGVFVSENDYGTAHDIVLDALDVHNVTGSNIKSLGGGSGISCQCHSTKTPTRFDGLLIENCHLVHTDRDGIQISGSSLRSAWFPNLHVIIRYNQLEDIGGDGIVPTSCDGALVEHNVLRGGRMRAQDAAAGIWPWSCDNTVLQYNIVSGMKGNPDGNHDGEGYDSDFNCRNTVFQYNYSYDNGGGFMLICDKGALGMPRNIGNIGTIIRYNVSVNDGLRLFNINGPCSNTQIYNNTIYVDTKVPHDINFGNWGGSWPTQTAFTNNIFYAVAPAEFIVGKATGVSFSHNVFYGLLNDRPAGTQTILTDPKLAHPGGDAASDYRLLPGSPCLNAGISVAESGGRDFSSSPVGAHPSIGAFQN